MTYSECVFVALGIQDTIRIQHIIIFGLPGSKMLFNIISQMARFFFKYYRTQNLCFDFSLQLLCEIFFIVRRIKTNMVKNVHLCSRRVPVALGGNTKFLEIFSKKIEYQIT